MLEREVRANIVYRHFTRIGWETVPDAKTLARIARALGPEVIERLHERLIEMARQERVVSGRKMRIDTTVVETNVHYPTDSSLLSDGLRVLTRTMRTIEQAAGGAGERLCDRLRSVAKIVMRIGRSTRSQQGAEQRRELYSSCWRSADAWWRKHGASSTRFNKVSRARPIRWSRACCKA